MKTHWRLFLLVPMVLFQTIGCQLAIEEEQVKSLDGIPSSDIRMEVLISHYDSDATDVIIFLKDPNDDNIAYRLGNNDQINVYSYSSPPHTITEGDDVGVCLLPLLCPTTYRYSTGLPSLTPNEEITVALIRGEGEEDLSATVNASDRIVITSPQADIDYDAGADLAITWDLPTSNTNTIEMSAFTCNAGVSPDWQLSTEDDGQTVLPANTFSEANGSCVVDLYVTRRRAGVVSSVLHSSSSIMFEDSGRVMFYY